MSSDAFDPCTKHVCAYFEYIFGFVFIWGCIEKLCVFVLESDVHFSAHLCMVYSSILDLATCQGISVFVSLMSEPPAAPSLAA